MASKAWKLLAVQSKCTFADLCSAKGIPYAHGCGFYQLSASENVSLKKLLVATNEDDGEIIAGDEVRKRLKLGDETNLRPAMVPSPWTLYVNSTSANRGLKPKTTVMVRLGNASVAGVVQQAEPEQEVKAATPKKKEAKAVSPPPTPPSKKAAGKKRSRSPSVERCDSSPQPPTKKALTEKAKKASSAETPPPIDGGKWTKRDTDGWVWDTTLMATETTGDKVPVPSAKIAAFDYDGCLAKTSLFKHGPDAWSVLFPSIPDCLKEIHARGYRLVIMSNQSAIGKATASKEKTIAEKKARFEGFVKQVGLPFTTMAATCKTTDTDKYRKPEAGMWEYLEKNLNGGIKIDKKLSFYVGDAAGRKGDHGDTDLKCAQKFGVPFFTEKDCFKDFAYRKLINQ